MIIKSKALIHVAKFIVKRLEEFGGEFYCLTLKSCLLKSTEKVVDESIC